MRPLAVALLVAVAALAGCADGDGPRADPTATSTGSSSSTTTTTTSAPQPGPPVLQLLAFELVGCHGISVQHTRPLDDVQALLPDGFTATAAPGAGNDATGVLAVDLFQCGNLTTATAAVPDTYVGLVYTYVERPVDRVPGASDAPVQEYVFRMLAGEDVLAQLWKAALYDTYNGTAAANTFEGTGPARVTNAYVGAEYTLYGTGVPIDALAAGRSQAFARYTVVPVDGSVLVWTGTYDLPASAVGPGAVEVAGSDPFARYAPPERSMLAGTAVQVDDGAVRGQVLSRVFT